MGRFGIWEDVLAVCRVSLKQSQEDVFHPIEQSPTPAVGRSISDFEGYTGCRTMQVLNALYARTRGNLLVKRRSVSGDDHSALLTTIKYALCQPC